MIKKGVICLLLFSTTALNISTGSASTCRNDIKKQNIIGTAALTLLTKLVKGNLRTSQDFFEALVYGGLSGYGFYEAKALVGNSNVITGTQLAYLSASVAENTTNGDNPLGYLRYGIQPFGVNFKTPLAKKEGNWATFEIDALGPIELINSAFFAGKNLRIQKGIITGTAKEKYCHESRAFVNNSVILTCEEHIGDINTFQHESIHVLQGIQLSAFDFKTRVHKNAVVRLGLVSRLATQLPFLLQNYGNRWFEREAFRMGEGSDVPSKSYDECTMSNNMPDNMANNISIGFSLLF